MPLEDVARFVSNLMADLEIDYVVIGGVAVSAQAEPRSTKDLDLVLFVEPSEVDRILDEIENRGLKISRKTKVSEKLKKGLPAKIIWDRKFSFDLRLASFTIDMNALDRAEFVQVKKYGISLDIASPEDLIVFKLPRFDDTDKKDIRNLLKMHGARLDWVYVQNQVEILDREFPGTEMKAALVEIRKW